jgi:magnesium transporter
LLGHLLKPEFEELIARKDWEALRVAFGELDPADIAEVLCDMQPGEAGVLFRILRRDVAGVAFEYLPLEQQTSLVQTLGSEPLAQVLNEMAPDDRTRLLEELPLEVTKRVLLQLSADELKVARQLLGYAEGTAGRYMTPEYMSFLPTLTGREALDHVRTKGKGRETLNVLYLVDQRGLLLADMRLADLVMADETRPVSEIETRALVSIQASALRDEIRQTFEKYDRVALPVTDSQGAMLGIITVDDVLDVAEAAATEDIQKLGGVEALDAPYMNLSTLEMVRKRGGWLAILLIGEMLTTTAMSYFEHEIERAVVLALFIPLIISSGGNSGSQATSLVIRALSLREIDLSDWWRVLTRELRSGVLLGAMLSAIGFIRIVLWEVLHRYGLVSSSYGQHFLLVAIAVSVSLGGVVLFGAVAGSMLPFCLRRLGLDPAAASAPFVATLVDVSGIVIYFTVASLVLRSTLLAH